MTPNEQITPVFDLPLTDQQLQCIGRMVCVFGAIEAYIDTMIMVTAGIHNKFTYEAFTNGKQLSGKLELMEKVGALRIKDAEICRKIKAACTAVKSIVTRRNDVVHGHWGYYFKSPLSVGEPISKGTPAVSTNRKVPKPFLASDLPALLMETEAAAHSVYQAWLSVCGDPTPTPKLPLKVKFSDRP